MGHQNIVLNPFTLFSRLGGQGHPRQMELKYYELLWLKHWSTRLNNAKIGDTPGFCRRSGTREDGSRGLSSVDAQRRDECHKDEHENIIEHFWFGFRKPIVVGHTLTPYQPQVWRCPGCCWYRGGHKLLGELNHPLQVVVSMMRIVCLYKGVQLITGHPVF